jgi:Fe-S-cluster containining protein
MNVDRVLQKARKSISIFCAQECKSYCCRKGYLVLSGKEIDIVTQNRRAELEKKKLLSSLDNGKRSLYMGNYENPCPSLLDCKCIIHKKKHRPKACKEFPIILKDNTIFFSTRCLAVKQNFFYALISRLKHLGYKVIISDQFYDSDFFNAQFS